MVGVSCQADGESWVCWVTVDHGGEQSVHTVTVTGPDLDRWAEGKGRHDAEELVARSFEFLLEREPAASILRRFDLSMIRSYFPAYDRQFRRRID